MSNIVTSANPSPADEIQTRRASGDEIDAALTLILSSGGRLPAAEQVSEFRAYVEQRGVGLTDLWITRDGRALRWAVLPVINPGRTALLLSPDFFVDQTPLSALGDVIDGACTDCAKRGAHLAQVLIDPDNHDALRVYLRQRFDRVADLHYLQAGMPRRVERPPLPERMDLVTYSPETRELFARTIALSYEASLDCPRLNGLREMDDVIAGHQAAGEFDPSTWFLLREGGTPIAVLLLNRVSQSFAMELVYLGLTPGARGRGLGQWLMKHAIATTCDAGLQRLTLAVDSANVPALKLYYRQGMERVASRAALVRDLRAAAGA